MQPKPASAHMRIARANIRRVTQSCRTADLTGLQRALELLQSTLSEMHLAEDAVCRAKLYERSELRREAALLKREVACLMRVIDGCAALHRGLSVRLGCTPLTYSPQSYSPQGRSVAAPAAAAYEMQG